MRNGTVLMRKGPNMHKDGLMRVPRPNAHEDPHAQKDVDMRMWILVHKGAVLTTIRTVPMSLRILRRCKSSAVPARRAS